WGVKWGRDFGKNGNLDFSYSSQLYQGNLDNGPFVDDRDYTSKATSHSFRGQYQVKNWTVRAFQDLIHREFRNDSTDIPANAWSKFGLSSYAGLSQGFEAFVKIPVKENSALLVGSEFRRQKTEQSDLSISDYGPYISPDLSEKQKTQQIVGTYATFQQNGRKIGYELGARWNAQSTFGNYFTYNLNPYWAISQTAKLFVNYYTSFKTPSIYQLASPYGNLNLQPEQGKTFELGVERKFKSWKIRVVGFQNEVNQGIVFQSMDVEPFGKYQNISRQKTQGIEFELSYQTAKLQADFNYTHLKGEMIDRDSTYSSLIRRPSNAWNLSLQYKLHAKWSVGMNNQYVGQRTDYFYDESSYSVQANPMDAYLWTDLSIHYQINKNWKLSGMLKNALNQEILEITGYSGPFRVILKNKEKSTKNKDFPSDSFPSDSLCFVLYYLCFRFAMQSSRLEFLIHIPPRHRIFPKKLDVIHRGEKLRFVHFNIDALEDLQLVIDLEQGIRDAICILFYNKFSFSVG
ncbi:MAG: hypothetical protein RLZ73_1233, partial [Bacteroidota bacterium]